MARDLAPLNDRDFNLLVVGGGVLGACVAWDAALRGLSVALVERDDFGFGASANSLKIVHGGLRHLQHLDLLHARRYARERSWWLRAAPHLVEPREFLVPARSSSILQSRSALRAALALDAIVGWDRNRALEADRRLPSGSMLTRSELRARVPELDQDEVTGGALFRDGVMYSAERLVWELVLAAEQAGAVVTNGLEAVDATPVDGAVDVRLRDRIADEERAVRARIVVNAAGSAVPKVATRLAGEGSPPPSSEALALNLVVAVDREDTVGVALGSGDTRGRSGRRFVFLPWRRRLLIGTVDYPTPREPGAGGHRPTLRSRVEEFLAEVNGVWPGRDIEPDDVVLVHHGRVPVLRRHGRVRYPPDPIVRDHGPSGADWLVSARTSKFTAARLGAKRVVDLALRKLGRRATPCRTGEVRLPGAPTGSVDSLLEDARRRYDGVVADDVLEHLVRAYGTRHEAVLAWRNERSDWDRRLVPGEPVVLAQALHALREERALDVDDVLWRRTELGPRGLVTTETRERVARWLELPVAQDGMTGEPDGSEVASGWPAPPIDPRSMR